MSDEEKSHADQLNADAFFDYYDLARRNFEPFTENARLLEAASFQTVSPRLQINQIA